MTLDIRGSFFNNRIFPDIDGTKPMDRKAWFSMSGKEFVHGSSPGREYPTLYTMITDLPFDIATDQGALITIDTDTWFYAQGLHGNTVKIIAKCRYKTPSIAVNVTE